MLVRADGTRYAKLVPAAGIGDLLDERDRLAWAAQQGVAVPRVLRWTQSDEGACLITSAVPGIPADALDPARALAAWPGIVRAARALHELPTDRCPADRRVDQRIAQAADVVERSAVHREFLRPEHVDADPRELLADLTAQLPLRRAQEARDLAVCHGDLCLPNILVDPGTLAVTGFIDLGRLGRADRHSDLALLLTNAQDTWPAHAPALAASLPEHYGAPVDPARIRFHLHLDPLTWG